MNANPEEPPPYPTGASTQQHAGLRFHLEIPDDFDAEKEYSLLVALHGAGASAESIASWYEPLLLEEFILCAPKATGPAWMKPDVEKAIEIVTHLRKVLPIRKNGLHATGFSNGGAHLGFLICEEKLPFVTACWMGSGFTGGRLPRRAGKELWVLALAGSRDPALGAAQSTAKRLRGKVARTCFLAQEGLGHEIPDELIPFHYHWMRAREGRFHPGEDGSFPWVDDLEAARMQIEEEKRPSFLYFFDERIPENPQAKEVQNEVFLDPLVQHFGRQIIPVKIDVELEEDYFAELGLKAVPAVVILSPEQEPLATFVGEISAAELAKALRAVAPNRSPPK